MKIILTMALMALTGLTSAQSDQHGFKNDMLEIMSNMKTYTVAIANQMPRDKYDFRPVNNDTVRTFAEQLKHVTVAMRLQTDNVLEGKIFDPRVTAQALAEYEHSTLSKAEIIRDLSEAFDKLNVKLSSMTESQFSEMYTLPFPGSEPKSYRVLMMFVRDHISHHRAQAIVYLRMNGITPIFYRPF